MTTRHASAEKAEDIREDQATPDAVPESSAAATDDAHSVVLKTRFGTISFPLANALSAPKGLPGFPDREAFGLAPVPDPRFEQFMLFQALDDESLSFIVLPVEQGSEAIKSEDLDKAASNLGMNRDDVAVLLVVSVRRNGDAAEISVNLQAPILVDTGQRIAVQYILGEGYPVRQVISTATVGGEGSR